MYASKAKLTVWFLGDKNLNIRVNIVLKGKISQKNFEKEYTNINKGHNKTRILWNIFLVKKLLKAAK